MIPAVMRATTETTAMVENRGTQLIANSQRASSASRRPRSMKASPPVHSAAETTWMTSDVSPSAPNVLA